MKNLTDYINEAKSENTIKKDLEELVKHCNIDANDEVFTLTKMAKEKKLYLYKTNSENELLDLYKNIVNNSKEYGKYFSFADSENEASSVAHKAATSIPSFKGFTLEKKF